MGSSTLNQGFSTHNITKCVRKLAVGKSNGIAAIGLLDVRAAPSEAGGKKVDIAAAGFFLSWMRLNDVSSIYINIYWRSVKLNTYELTKLNIHS